MTGFFAHQTAVIDEGAKVGEGTRIWHFSHVMASAQIGKDCILGQNVYVGSKVVLGDRVKVQNNVSIYTGVLIEDEVFLGPSMVFTNVINPRAHIERKDEFKPTTIRKGVSVGANATIICGIELGEYCFIGAGAVVTKDVPPFAIVTGNPARHSGWMSAAGEKLEFDAAGFAVCPADNTSYRLQNGRVTRLK